MKIQTILEKSKEIKTFEELKEFYNNHFYYKNDGIEYNLDINSINDSDFFQLMKNLLPWKSDTKKINIPIYDALFSVYFQFGYRHSGSDINNPKCFKSWTKHKSYGTNYLITATNIKFAEKIISALDSEIPYIELNSYDINSLKKCSFYYITKNIYNDKYCLLLGEPFGKNGLPIPSKTVGNNNPYYYYSNKQLILPNNFISNDLTFYKDGKPFYDAKSKTSFCKTKPMKKIDFDLDKIFYVQLKASNLDQLFENNPPIFEDK